MHCSLGVFKWRSKRQLPPTSSWQMMFSIVHGIYHSNQGSKPLVLKILWTISSKHMHVRIRVVKHGIPSKILHVKREFNVLFIPAVLTIENMQYYRCIHHRFDWNPTTCFQYLQQRICPISSGPLQWCLQPAGYAVLPPKRHRTLNPQGCKSYPGSSIISSPSWRWWWN